MSTPSILSQGSKPATKKSSKAVHRGPIDALPPDVLRRIAAFVTVNELTALSRTNASCREALAELEYACTDCRRNLFSPLISTDPIGCTHSCDPLCGMCCELCEICHERTCRCSTVACKLCDMTLCEDCNEEIFCCTRCSQLYCSDCEIFNYYCEKCDEVYCSDCSEPSKCSACGATFCRECNEESFQFIRSCNMHNHETETPCNTHLCGSCQPGKLWTCGFPICDSALCMECFGQDQNIEDLSKYCTTHCRRADELLAYHVRMAFAATIMGMEDESDNGEMVDEEVEH